MKTKLYFIIIFLLAIPFICDAQKEDFVWKTGKTQNWPGTTFYKFNNCSFELGGVPDGNFPLIRDGGSKSTMADKDGNLLFYTDGYDIFNSEHQIMENGDSLFNFAPPGFSDFYNKSGGYHDNGRNLILPLPSHEYKYFVFSQDYESVQGIWPGAIGTNINYSLIDLSKNNGLGEVVEKRNILMENDFESGQLKAIRHANGRDWWFVVKAWEKSKWYMFILDPDGIRLSHVEEVNEIPDFGASVTAYNYPRDNFFLLRNRKFPSHWTRIGMTIAFTPLISTVVREFSPTIDPLLLKPKLS
jgi:hypothetical protein